MLSACRRTRSAPRHAAPTRLRRVTQPYLTQPFIRQPYITQKHLARVTPLALLTATAAGIAGLALVSSPPAPADAAPGTASLALAGAAGPGTDRAPGIDATLLLAPSRPAADVLLGSPPPAPGPQRAVADVLLGSPPAPPPPPPPSPEELERASRAERALTVVSPVDGAVTSGFGARWGRQHKGLDYGAPTGTPVSSVAAGTVQSATYDDSGYGNLVTVAHDDGTVTAYAHLSTILVGRGDPLLAGDLVGLVGSTGRSTGPHLHFEVRVGGSQVNPATWLAERGL